MKAAQLTVYPTALKVEDQLRRLSGVGCALGFRITTLPQIVEALWRESGVAASRLSPIGERLAMLEAWTRTHPAAQAETSAAGMLESYGPLLRTLKGDGIGFQHWNAALTLQDDSQRIRLDDFSRFFAHYEELVRSQQLADYHDREITALEYLLNAEGRGARPRWLEGVSKLLVAEIYDLSLVQFMIVAALIRLIGDAEVTIQAAPHKVSADRFAELTWNRFVAEESIADKVLPDFIRRGGREGALGYLIEHIFGPETPENGAPRDDTVRFLVELNPRAEAERVADLIRDRMEAAPGAPLGRIGIVARDLDAYRDYLISAFRRARIPLTLHARSPLRASIPARTVINLLRIPAEGYRRAALLGLTAAPFIESGLSRYRYVLQQAGYIDQKTRSLSECFKRYREQLERTPADDENARENLRMIATRFERGAAAWGRLVERFATIDGEATICEHIDNLRRLLADFRFNPLKDSITGESARAAASLYQTLNELSAAAAQILPTRNLSLAQFVEVLETAFAQTEIGGPDPSTDGVQAMSAADARGLDFEVLFLLGLNDGRFPRHHPQNPLIPDSTLRALNRSLIEVLRGRFGAHAPNAPGPVLRSRPERNSEEFFLFFLTLSMPTGAIVLSCAKEDESGSPLARSPFFDEAARLLGSEPAADASMLVAPAEDADRPREFLLRAALAGVDETSQIEAGIDPRRVRSIVARSRIERARGAYLARPTREALLHARKLRQKEWLDYRAALAPDADKAASATNYDGRVTPDARLRRLLLEAADGGPHPWSATRLSELASCGFKYFSHRILRLNDAEVADSEPNPPEIGEIAHLILHDLMAAGLNFRDRAEALETAARIAEKRRAQELETARDPAFFDAHWGAIRAMVEEMVQYESNRRAGETQPASELLLEHDFNFGLAGADSGGADIKVQVNGRIDRVELERGVDELIERVRVIDYKNSRSRKRLDELMRESTFGASDLQIPVYLLAALHEFRDRLAFGASLEAGYIALKHRDKAPEILRVPLERLDGEDRGATDGSLSVRDRVLGLVQEALDGHFEVDPLRCSEFCPYRRICRIDSRG